jgi:hypothetical protein
MNLKNISLVVSTVVLATSIFFVTRSCDKYTEAMAALNANPDYVESITLDNARGHVYSASSELEYTPERVWHESYETCNHRDEDGTCTSHSTHYRTRRTPENCPDPSDAKSHIANANNLLEMTGGSGEKGINNENKPIIERIKEVSSEIPDGHELCYINGYHASESTFSQQRSALNLAGKIIDEHSDEHYAKVPEDLKSNRNWSIFGIIASILGIAGSVVFGGFCILRIVEQ